MVANAQPNQYEDVRALIALSVPIPEWLEPIFQEWFNDPPTC